MQDLITRLRTARRVAILAHIRPDGDAVGSVIGFALGLEQAGIAPVPVLKDGVPEAFRFLEGSSRVATTLPDDADLCIVLDSPDASRTGYLDQVKRYANAGKLLLIDHHTKGDLLKVAAATHYNPAASSCAELVTELLQELGIRLNPAMSTALLVGMYTDTGGFQYGNTTNHTLEVAAELMRRGARLSRIVQQVARQRSVAGLKLLGTALSRLTLTPDRKGAVTVLSLADLAAAGATPEDATGLINSLNVLPEVAYCLLVAELEPGTIRGTLRTAEGHTFDVARYAAAFGGGGHPRAAGFALAGHLEQTGNGWRIA